LPRQQIQTNRMTQQQNSPQSTPHAHFDAIDALGARLNIAPDIAMLQKPLFDFLNASFSRWPLDRLDLFPAVVDLWLCWIQPWTVVPREEFAPSVGASRGRGSRGGTRDGGRTVVEDDDDDFEMGAQRQAAARDREKRLRAEHARRLAEPLAMLDGAKSFDESWQSYVLFNLPFYTILLEGFVRSAHNLDFSLPQNTALVHRVLTAFCGAPGEDQNNLLLPLILDADKALSTLKEKLSSQRRSHGRRPAPASRGNLASPWRATPSITPTARFTSPQPFLSGTPTSLARSNDPYGLEQQLFLLAGLTPLEYSSLTDPIAETRQMAAQLAALLRVTREAATESVDANGNVSGDDGESSQGSGLRGVLSRAASNLSSLRRPKTLIDPKLCLESERMLVHLFDMDEQDIRDQFSFVSGSAVRVRQGGSGSWDRRPDMDVKSQTLTQRGMRQLRDGQAVCSPFDVVYFGSVWDRPVTSFEFEVLVWLLRLLAQTLGNEAARRGFWKWKGCKKGDPGNAEKLGWMRKAAHKGVLFWLVMIFFMLKVIF
jgi:hypothetical protein